MTTTLNARDIIYRFAEKLDEERIELENQHELLYEQGLQQQANLLLQKCTEAFALVRNIYLMAEREEERAEQGYPPIAKQVGNLTVVGYNQNAIDLAIAVLNAPNMAN